MLIDYINDIDLVMNKALITKEEFDIKVDNLLSRSSNQINFTRDEIARILSHYYEIKAGHNV